MLRAIVEGECEDYTKAAENAVQEVAEKAGLYCVGQFGESRASVTGSVVVARSSTAQLAAASELPDEVVSRRSSIRDANFGSNAGIQVGNKSASSAVMYKDALTLAKTVWTSLESLADSMPLPLKVILHTAADTFSTWNNKGALRQFLEFILIENFVVPALRSPLQRGLTDECELPAMYCRYVGSVCQVLRKLVCGQRFLPHEPLSAYANNMILTSQ